MKEKKTMIIKELHLNNFLYVKKHGIHVESKSYQFSGCLFESQRGCLTLYKKSSMREGVSRFLLDNQV